MRGDGVCSSKGNARISLVAVLLHTKGGSVGRKGETVLSKLDTDLKQLLEKERLSPRLMQPSAEEEVTGKGAAAAAEVVPSAE